MPNLLFDALLPHSPEPLTLPTAKLSSRRSSVSSTSSVQTTASAAVFDAYQEKLASVKEAKRARSAPAKPVASKAHSLANGSLKQLINVGSFAARAVQATLAAPVLLGAAICMGAALVCAIPGAAVGSTIGTLYGMIARKPLPAALAIGTAGGAGVAAAPVAAVGLALFALGTGIFGVNGVLKMVESISRLGE